MTSKTDKTFEQTNEEIYLTDIHKKGSEQDVIDLHTYLYWRDFESCPI